MNKAPKILLVEDDPLLGEGLLISLKLEGYDVDWAMSMKAGEKAFSEGSFDLAVLDIGLPDGSGLDLCRTLRQKNSSVAIIFLTAKTDEETLIRGLEEGANDFVKKPFSHRELMARIKSHLRLKAPKGSLIQIGKLALNVERREASFDHEPLTLNRRQFDILSYFLSRPDQIITREQLLQHLDQENAIFDRTIDSHLSQLRKILKAAHVEDLQIISVYGVGYRLEIH